MSQIVIGVDIAKLKFDVARLCEGKYRHKKFDNNPAGFAAFIAWLTRFADEQPWICMEATGAYSIPLAEWLTEQDYRVSVVNPAKIHTFAKCHQRWKENVIWKSQRARVVLEVPCHAESYGSDNGAGWRNT